jgi:hypothetical protein
MATTDVLSSSFFHLYDQLGQEASSLEDASAALKNAKSQRDQAQRELRKHQIKTRQIRSFIQEQNNRIALVSSHWFFGTTLWQPQLWMRGGCQGKIVRARSKLTKAQDQDLPQLLESIQTLQEVQVPKWQLAVDEELHQFELSANAASEREVMRQRAFEEYPSPKLLQVEAEQLSLQHKMSNAQREGANLNDVLSHFFEGQTLYQRAQRSLMEDALRNNEKYETLKHTTLPVPKPLESLHARNPKSRSETQVANGTKIVVLETRSSSSGQKDLFHLNQDGSILTTNFPCPNHCGFLVSWHETHCCNACRKSNNAAGAQQHGQRCERKPIRTQQGALQKLVTLQKEQQDHAKALTRANDACNRAFTQARKEAKQAERIVQQALNEIAIAIRERYANVCTNLMMMSTTMHPPNSPHGGCFCDGQVRASNIKQEIEGVARSLRILAQQLAIVQQLQTQIGQETQTLEQQLQNLTTILEGEQNRIFHELRAQVMGVGTTVPAPVAYDTSSTPPSAAYDPVTPPPAFAPHISLPPSAPTEDQLVASMFEPTATDAVPMAVATPLTDSYYHT